MMITENEASKSRRRQEMDEKTKGGHYNQRKESASHSHRQEPIAIQATMSLQGDEEVWSS